MLRQQTIEPLAKDGYRSPFIIIDEMNAHYTKEEALEALINMNKKVIYDVLGEGE